MVLVGHPCPNHYRGLRNMIARGESSDFVFDQSVWRWFARGEKPTTMSSSAAANSRLVSSALRCYFVPCVAVRPGVACGLRMLVGR